MSRPLSLCASLLVYLALTSAASAHVVVGAPAVGRGAASHHLIVYVRTSVDLHARPFGRVLKHVGSRTEFGSPRTFAVVQARHGRWLGVTEPGIGNERLAWLDARAGGLRYAATQLQLEIDLSQRTLTLRSGTHVLRQLPVAVGAPSSPTPAGRFALTDKLDGPSYSTSYGCCILALSATQPNLQAGWTGGNRIAIHGTSSSSDFGRAVSAGCVHARDPELRYLVRVVPLGTPVIIHR